MDNIKVNALMLRATDYRDNDKILTLLTAEMGKITAGIKGVKKAGAKLKFAAQPFCFAEYILTERGGRYTVTQASECESFYELRQDVNKYYAACAVAECAAALTEEGESDGIFSDAVRALKDMCAGDEGNALITFLLSALKRSGYGITLSHVCPVCKRDLFGEERLRFNMENGSFSCWECTNHIGASGSTYRALKGAEEGKYEYPEGKRKALKLLKEYLAYKTEARLLSLAEYIDML